jgi:hypothetical protein
MVTVRLRQAKETIRIHGIASSISSSNFARWSSLIDTR